MDKNDKKFVMKILENKQKFGNHQKMTSDYYKWVKLSIYKQGETTKRSHKISDRIFICTKYRIIIVRKTTLSHAVRFNIPLILLSELVVDKTDFNVFVRLTFQLQQEVISVQYDDMSEAKPLIVEIVKASKAITTGWPKRITPKFTIPDSLTKSISFPELTPEQAITTGYNVACDLNQIKPKKEIFKNLLEALAPDRRGPNKHLNIGDIFTSKKRGEFGELDINHLRSVIHAIKHTDCFREIVVNCPPLGDAGVAEVSKMFAANKHVTSIVMDDCGFGRDGARHIGKSLASGKLKLEILSLVNNQIGNDGIDAMCMALQKCQGPNAKKKLTIKVKELDLRECGFSAEKGFRPLATLLLLPSFSKTLKRVNISDNNAAKLGSSHLADWMRECENLEEFIAQRCNLDLGILFTGLSANSKLYKRTMKIMNVGGQKMSDRAASALGTMLKSTRSLETVDLNNVKFDKVALMDILKGISENRHKEVQFHIDLTACHLGDSGASLIQDTLSPLSKIENIKTLLMSENQFGGDGVVKVVRTCLKIPSLTFLDLDGNVRGSEKGEKAGEALAKLVQHGRMPNLRLLCVAGMFQSEQGPCYLKESLYPLLLELPKNETLTVLDISKNRIGHEGIQILAKALSEDNKTLEQLYIDDNKIELASMRALAKAMKTNRKVVTILPIHDSNKLATKLKHAERVDLKNYVKKIEDACRRNRKGFVPKSDKDNFVLEQIMTKKHGAPAVVKSMGKVKQLQQRVEVKRQKPKIKKSVKHISVEDDPDLGPQNNTKEFGLPLVDIRDNVDIDEYKTPIPAVLVRLEKYLVKNGGLEAPKIFSMKGNEEELKRVRKSLNKGTFETTKDIFVIGHLIRSFFEELPQKLCSSARIDEHWEDRIERIIASIRNTEQAIFRWLLNLLGKVSRKSRINKQTPRNLAKIFGPILFNPIEEVNIVDVMELCIVQSKSELKSTALHKIATIRAPIIASVAVENCTECGSEREDVDGEPARFCGVCGHPWEEDDEKGKEEPEEKPEEEHEEEEEDEDDRTSTGTEPTFAGLGEDRESVSDGGAEKSRSFSSPPPFDVIKREELPQEVTENSYHSEGDIEDDQPPSGGPSGGPGGPPPPPIAALPEGNGEGDIEQEEDGKHEEEDQQQSIPAAAAAPPPIFDVMKDQSSAENQPPSSPSNASMLSGGSSQSNTTSYVDQFEDDDTSEDEERKVEFDKWEDRPVDALYGAAADAPGGSDEAIAGGSLEKVKLRPVSERTRPEIVMKIPRKEKKKPVMAPALVHTIARRRKERHERERAFLSLLGTEQSSSDEEY